LITRDTISWELLAGQTGFYSGLASVTTSAVCLGVG
jgi:hypothetical protein